MVPKSNAKANSNGPKAAPAVAYSLFGSGRPFGFCSGA
jgi:hypothetical protein